ncbi:MAG: PD-(D/E)XK nuclease family protein [Alphaproteobacteria bacterium]|nr:PD-(D/E)XK nuclease family protein [Alphaproteobacteria bacterium]
MATDNISALENFERDMNIITEKLNPYLDQVNIFSVLGLTNTEIRHSYMLAWLLDSGANHGLGNCFVRKLLKSVGIKTDEDVNFSVYREFAHIDIMLVSEKENKVVVIENKIWTDDHDEQLKKYHRFIAKKYNGFEQRYFYLTPDKRTPTDKESAAGWEILSYREVVNCLQKAVKETKLESKEVKLLLNNYINILRRDIVKDDKLIDLCNEIYAKYHKAIDLINEYRIQSISGIIEKILHDLNKEKTIIYNSKSKSKTTFSFYTYRMDKKLPPLDKNDSSWKTNRLYVYEVNILPNNNVRVIFSLSGEGLTNSAKNFIKETAKITETKEPKKGFKYYTPKTEVLELETNEKDVENKIKGLICKIFDWENELITD